MKVSKEFLKYCLVGIINTFVGISTAYICLNIFLLTYIESIIMAYITGISVSFVLNKLFTFKDKNENYLKQFFKFVIIMLPSYAISYTLGWFLARHIHFAKLTPIYIKLFDYFGVPEYKLVDNSAVLISMILYLILGFSLNKFLVFERKKLSPITK